MATPDAYRQCAFACKRKWTIRGLIDYIFSVFIHIGSRRIRVSPCTASPTGEWTTQSARNFDMFLQDDSPSCTILQCDQDAKYVQTFDDVFMGDDRKVKVALAKSPDLQAFVELAIQVRKHEVLNSFCVVNEKYLDRILTVGADC